jgi:hypothetical protein
MEAASRTAAEHRMEAASRTAAEHRMEAGNHTARPLAQSRTRVLAGTRA